MDTTGRERRARRDTGGGGTGIASARARAEESVPSSADADALLTALGALHGRMARGARARGARADDWDDAVQDAAVRLLEDRRLGRPEPDRAALDRRVADRASGLVRRERRRRTRLRLRAALRAPAGPAAESEPASARLLDEAAVPLRDPRVRSVVALLQAGLGLGEAARALSLEPREVVARTLCPTAGRGVRMLALHEAGWSPRDIAHVEGLTCVAVRVALHRARRRV